MRATLTVDDPELPPVLSGTHLPTSGGRRLSWPSSARIYENCLFDVHGKLNRALSHGSTMAYLLCYGCTMLPLLCYHYLTTTMLTLWSVINNNCFPLLIIVFCFLEVSSVEKNENIYDETNDEALKFKCTESYMKYFVLGNLNFSEREMIVFLWLYSLLNLRET